MNDFNKCKTIEEAKTIFRKLAFENHPDQGGTEEGFKKLMKAYELFLNMFVANKFEAAGDKAQGATMAHFQDILNKIINFDMDIEIIGFWIYAKSSYNYKDELKDLGFWFSGKHKAWVYSGGAKIRRSTRLSLDQIREIHGSEKMKSEQPRGAIA